ncbi:acyl-CoA dehydrogenase family protein [Sphingomonas xanthus]|uniref:acyl-CoA dehydrogenase family protein n=1 Tax=Sphingomonas xanthus TaxID=2594473 RepID=UPI001C9D0664|nr:acyl-CoA dehydrogenase family protein [Sphingomonas xanthus]
MTRAVGLDLAWPFFEAHHSSVAAAAAALCDTLQPIDHEDEDAACRALVAAMGKAGLLTLSAPTDGPHDVRALAITRERLAYHSGLADFAFAMQGLGFGPVMVAGTETQKAEWGARVRGGSAIAAFALTEPGAGSDAARVATRATRDGSDWLIDGEKTYISNGPIADIITLFARTSDEGARGLTAFILPANTPGLSVAERIAVVAPHPLARLRLDSVRLPDSARLGEVGEGFTIAMATLNIFRVTVGAAALGLARRALDEAIAFASQRPLGNAMLVDNAVTQDRIGTMATRIDAAALLIARAAWAKDTQDGDHRRSAAMAKLEATEMAQQVIDSAVQLHGGLGVTVGARVEALYREIRALRIYEGASEVQRMIIARTLLK